MGTTSRLGLTLSLTDTQLGHAVSNFALFASRALDVAFVVLKHLRVGLVYILLL